MFKTRTTRRIQKGGDTRAQKAAAEGKPVQSVLEKATAAAVGKALETNSTSSNAIAAPATEPIQGLCSWRGSDKESAIKDWKAKLSPELTFLATAETLTNDQYETVVEFQDKLFGMAMQIIYEKLDIKPDDAESTILQKYNDTVSASIKYITYKKSVNLGTVQEDGRNEPLDPALLKEYIEDIARLIYKGDVVTVAPSGAISPSKTKVELLLKSDNLLEILLNPGRVKNQFIQVLAAFIIHQRQKTSLLNTLNGNTQAAELLATRYDALVKANTLLTTTTELRDGMILTMPTATPAYYKSFWLCFVMRCIGKYYDGKNNIADYVESFAYNAQQFNIVKGYNKDGDDYAFIAAAIYTEKLSNEFLKSLDEKYKQFATHLMHALGEPPSSPETAAPAESTDQ